jgi:hypothetical protein
LTISLFEILTILAILVGPIAAVMITRRIDDRRAKEHRRREVFSTLMRTRRFKLSVDHVNALNLIQIEFYGRPDVAGAYQQYISHLNSPIPSTTDEQSAFFERREDLFVDLVHSIARELKYDLDKRDLAKLAYGPVGWINDDEEIRAMRRAVLELLSGRRPLPVFAWQLQGGIGPFPPVPTVDQEGDNSSPDSR